VKFFVNKPHIDYIIPFKARESDNYDSACKSPLHRCIIWLMLS